MTFSLLEPLNHKGVMKAREPYRAMKLHAPRNENSEDRMDSRPDPIATSRQAALVAAEATLDALDPVSWREQVAKALGNLRNGGASAYLEVEARKACRLIAHVEQSIQKGVLLVWEDYALEYDRWESTPPDPNRGVRALPEYQRQASIDRVGGIVLLAGDCGVATYFLVDNFLDLETSSPAMMAASVVVGVLFSIGIALGTEALAAKRILQPEGQPRVGKRRGRRISTVLGFLGMLAFAGFVIARSTVTLPDEFANRLADLSLAGLAIVLPLLSGVLLGLARHLGWSAMHERRARAWQELARDTEVLARECEGILGIEFGEDEDDDDPGTPASVIQQPPRSGPRTEDSRTISPAARSRRRRSSPWLRRSRGLLVLPFLAASLNCGGAAASANAGAADAPTEVSDREIFTDTTASIDFDVLNRTLPQVARSLASPDFTGTIRVTPFADNGWRATVKDSVVLEGYQDPDCSDLERDIQKKRLKRIRRALREACTARKDSVRNAVDSRRRTAADQLARIAVPRGLDVEVCTALWEVLRRVSRQAAPYVAVITTDGQDTCDPEPAPLSQPSPGVKVTIVILPSVPPYRISRSDAVHFDTVKAQIQRVAPWVRVIAPSEVTRSLF
jgi:hypothetical protein